MQIIHRLNYIVSYLWG